MLSAEIQSYIANLQIVRLSPTPQPEEDGSSNPIDVDNLPATVVTGSNLVHFSEETTPAIRTSVALSLLLAQRVASDDPVIKTPQQWVERQNTVLTNLNWVGEPPRIANFEFKKINEAVSQAIIPFLTDAFGDSPGGGNPILDALNQLTEDKKHAPWFSLFDRQSQRFQVTEYQFSLVAVAGTQAILKIANARFDATFGQTQVFFIRTGEQHASFQGASQGLSARATEVADMRDSLKLKLAGLARALIQTLSV